MRTAWLYLLVRIGFEGAVIAVVIVSAVLALVVAGCWELLAWPCRWLWRRWALWQARRYARAEYVALRRAQAVHRQRLEERRRLERIRIASQIPGPVIRSRRLL